MAAQEVQFVASPDARAEDDGLLLMMGYDFTERSTSLFAIDA